MALADAYEETTAALVHEQRSTHQQAVDMIMKSAGRRFDPMLVDAFVSVQEDFDQIRCALAESKGCHIPNRNAD
jgi:putative two-component system response regulator